MKTVLQLPLSTKTVEKILHALRHFLAENKSIIIPLTAMQRGKSGPGGGGGVLNSFIRGGSAPSSNPLPFHMPFWKKRYPFYLPLIEKRYPFHIPILGSLVLVFM